LTAFLFVLELSCWRAAGEADEVQY